MRVPTRLLLLAVSAGAALVALVVAVGGIDALARDGRVDRLEAIAAVVAYWALLCGAILLVRAAWRTPARVLGATVATALALACSEVGLGVFAREVGVERYRVVPSREVHHELPAGRTLSMGQHDGVQLLVQTNQDGLRSTWSRAAFQAQRQRVLVLGDSFAFGLGVQQEDTVVSNLERELRRRLGREDVAALNAGVVSYSPILQRQQIERLLPTYRPTVVVLMLDASDIGDDLRYAKEASRDGDRLVWDLPFDDPAPWRGRVFEVLRPLAETAGACLAYPFRALGRHEVYDYYRFGLEIGGVVEHNRYFILRHPLTLTRPYLDATRDRVLSIAARCRTAGAAFLLVVLPRFQHWDPSEAPQIDLASEGFARHEPYQDVYLDYFASPAETPGLRVFSLLPAFRASTERPLVFAADPHWNERGNALAACALAEHLLTQGLVY